MDGTLNERFKPARSCGWLWLVVLMAIMAVSLVPLIVEEGELISRLIGLAVLLPLMVGCLLVLFALPSMRYELAPDTLLIICGPFLHYRIPYSSITDVRRTNLTPSLWSSMRMPGLALWGVPYADTGTVHMCATRMARNIMLISTHGRRYGITPADEDRFAAALLMRLPRGR